MISWEEILIRLALAAFFGAVVGLERERRDWAAGLRTHMMVCVGACLIMMVSAFGFRDVLGTPDIVLDPSRIAAQVVSGIGFIGAGTIMFLRQEVIRGLTTAAGLWTVAAIGLATGGGMYFAACVTTVVVIIILWMLKPVELRIFKRYKMHVIRLQTTSADAIDPSLLVAVNDVLATGKVDFTNLSVEKKDTGSVISLRITGIGGTARIIEIVNKLQTIPAISNVSWDRGN
jgi:putative Mg2+ transporter-C (MgtC) family protein